MLRSRSEIIDKVTERARSLFDEQQLWQPKENHLVCPSGLGPGTRLHGGREVLRCRLLRVAL